MLQLFFLRIFFIKKLTSFYIDDSTTHSAYYYYSLKPNNYSNVYTIIIPTPWKSSV